MAHFDFISESHLGDCLLHAHYMRSIINLDSSVSFNFYLISNHWKQTYEYIEDLHQIKCLPYKDAPRNAYRGWVGQFGIPPLPCPLDSLRLNSYQNLSKLIGLQCPFNTEYDLLYDNPKILKRSKQLPTFDVLLINSIPLSNQIDYVETDYKNLAEAIMRKGKTVITTSKISNIPCTLDLGLTVMDIGALSINCKIIAGIGTGAMQCCLNIWTKSKKIFYIDKHHTFNMKHVTMINNINVLIP